MCSAYRCAKIGQRDIWSEAVVVCALFGVVIDLCGLWVAPEKWSLISMKFRPQIDSVDHEYVVENRVRRDFLVVAVNKVKDHES